MDGLVGRWRGRVRLVGSESELGLGVRVSGASAGSRGAIENPEIRRTRISAPCIQEFFCALCLGAHRLRIVVLSAELGRLLDDSWSVAQFQPGLKVVAPGADRDR